MAQYCKLTPDKGVDLFNNLKTKYGYKAATDLWALSQSPTFQQKTSLKLDDEGFPTMSALMATSDAKRILGEQNLVKGMEREFSPMPNTAENASSLIWKAHQFNDRESNKDWVAIVETRDNANALHVSIKRRTQENELIATDQYSTHILNNRLVRILEPLGVTIGNLTEAELKAGRVGVTDFTKVRNIAEDSISVIRVANNQEGYRALSEEFSHLMIGIFHNDVLVQRALKVLQDEDVLKAILGDEYTSTEEFQNSDISMIAEEALGQLLQQNLLAQVSNDPVQTKFIMQKLYDKIRSKFKRIDADRIQDAIIEANNYIGQLAKELLNNQRQLSIEKVKQAERDAQFNALSDRINANIEILKKLKDVEIKRYKISQGNSEFKSKQSQKIQELQKLTKGEQDTRIGIYNYGLQAIEELKSIEESLNRHFLTGMPSYATLRRARSYIQSYGLFIHEMRNAIIDSAKDEDVPDFLTDIQLKDGTVVSMQKVVDDLENLSSHLITQYHKYAQQATLEFFRPFYGKDLTYTMGKHAGESISLDAIISGASHDISIADMYIDSMADSSNLFLQLFDAVVKKTNDNIRNQTIRDSHDISRLRMYAEKNGITDFEWLFEHDSSGHKSGNYVSEYNIGEYQRQRKLFLKNMEEKYGKIATGEDANKKAEEIKQWYKDNASSDNPFLPAEIDRWRNVEYATIMDNPVLKYIYEEFLELKANADRKYPDKRVETFKAIQRRKSTGNRIFDSITNPSTLIDNLKGYLKESILEAEDDDQLYGDKSNALTNFDGTEYMALPVLYTSRLKNPDELSTDIFADLLLYTFSANTYEGMDTIVDPLEVAKSLVTDKIYKVEETRGEKPVQEVIKDFGDKVVNKVYKGDSNIERKLNEWFESQVYHRYMKDAGVWDIGSLHVSKSKLGQAVLSMSSLASMGFNWLANMANVATSVAMTNIEVAAGQYFNAAELWNSDCIYTQNLPELLAEIGSREKKNFLSLFCEKFNIQAEYETQLKTNQKKNIFQKLFGTNTAYLMDKCGNHWVNTRIALAMCQHIKVFVPKTSIKKAQKVRSIDDALNAVDHIIENSAHMQLTEDEKEYVNSKNGKHYSRVTSVISNPEDTFSESWKVPSTNIGTGIDELVRDFFSGELLKTTDGKWHHNTKGDDMLTIYPNVKQEDLDVFLEQLIELNESFKQQGLHVVSRGITARGVLKVNQNGENKNLDVAGTLDLLVYDNKGNFYIYDMKTHRGNIKPSTEQKWSKQLSLYKRFLEEEYGISIKGLRIIPIKVNYDTPKGERSKGEDGTAEYSVVEGTNQLLINGKKFDGAKPTLNPIISLPETKKLSIEYDNLGAEKSKVTNDLDDYQEMSLLEALEIRNVYADNDDIKEMVLKEGTVDENGNTIDLDKVSRQIQDIAIHLFGAYNSEDANVANRTVVGKAIMQFRKWIKPQFNVRFQKAEIDYITETTREGYYNTAMKYAYEKFAATFLNESMRGKFQIAAHWSELTNEQKYNIRRAAFEMLQLLAWALICNFMPWPDDKKRPWYLKMSEYLVKRELHELGMLVPSPLMLQEILKTVKSPAACLTIISNIAALIESMFFSPQDYFDEIQSGPYKGMSTFEKNLTKAPIFIIQWIRQVDKFTGELDTSINYYARTGY